MALQGNGQLLIRASKPLVNVPAYTIKPLSTVLAGLHTALPLTRWRLAKPITSSRWTIAHGMQHTLLRSFRSY
jgi:hypothetical protein